MKKISILVTLLVLCATLFAQAPEKFSYQAVVRNASNALVTNAPVGVRVSILQGSASGNAVYVETHTASTNANGLLTVEIGGGTVQQGSFAGINWANGPFFLKTETDPAGGTNYTVTSTQQLMSVPYALYAEEAGNGFSGDYNDLTNKPTIPTMEQVQAMINTAVNDAVGAMQQQVDSLQEIVSLMRIYTVPSSGTRTVNLDNTVNHVDVYDQNGPNGDYGNNWDGSLTLVTNSSDKVFKITGSYHTESLSWDTILIYNGTGANGANTIVKLGGTGAISEPIYSSGNTITIRFKSDGSIVKSGFALSIDIVDKPSCTAAKAVDREGHYYNTVLIGNQCWMKENLRTTKYADGASISNGGSYGSETTPYYYDYSSSSIPLAQRGYLYNWKAVMRNSSTSSANPSGVQGICPSGWHVPSDAEWTQLTDYVSSHSQYVCGSNSTYIAKALASTSGWNSSANTCAVGNAPTSNNASGFSAVPAGRWNDGFDYAGDDACFWSSTEYDGAGFVWSRYLYYNNAGVSRGYSHRIVGFSVRCLRD